MVFVNWCSITSILVMDKIYCLVELSCGDLHRWNMEIFRFIVA